MAAIHLKHRVVYVYIDKGMFIDKTYGIRNFNDSYLLFLANKTEKSSEEIVWI